MTLQEEIYQKVGKPTNKDYKPYVAPKTTSSMTLKEEVRYRIGEPLKKEKEQEQEYKPYKPVDRMTAFRNDLKRANFEINQREEIEKEREIQMRRYAEYVSQTEDNYADAERENTWKKIIQNTFKPSALVPAAKKVFKSLTTWKTSKEEETALVGAPIYVDAIYRLTPKGVRAAGRGFVKGLLLGYVAPKSPHEIDETERAIEEAFEMVGFLAPFMAGTAAVNTAFKAVGLTAKLGRFAPLAAEATSWVLVSQAHKDMRGADYQERAKQAGIDLVVVSSLGVLGLAGKAVGRTITRPKITQKMIPVFKSLLVKNITKDVNAFNYIPSVKSYVKSLNLSRAKTIKEAVDIFNKGLAKDVAKAKPVRQAVKSTTKEIEESITQAVKTAKATIAAKEPKTAQTLIEKMRDKLVPTSKTKVSPRLTPEKEYETLEYLSRELGKLPGMERTVKSINIAKSKLKVGKPKTIKPTIKMTKPTVIKIQKVKSKGIQKVKTPLVENIAYVAKKFKVITSKRVKEESEKIIKRSEIAERISKAVDVPIRRGHFDTRGGKVLGIYKRIPEIIRIKSGGFPTITHEVGHHIEKGIPSILKNMNNETEILRLLADYGGKVSGKRARQEAFAEYLRLFIVDPIQAQKRSPKFHKFFRKLMEENYPEIRDALLIARRDYRRWTEMPFTARTLSQISFKQKKKGIKERLPERVDELYTLAKDDLYSLKKFDALMKKELGDVPVEELPYVLARLLKGGAGKAETFLEKGTFRKKFWKMDMNGKKVQVIFAGKSLKDILRPIERAGNLTNFSLYLTNKRAFELSGRKIATGISKSDAIGTLKELTKKYPEFKKAATELYKYQDDILMYGYDCGLYDLKTLLLFKKANQYYVPFYRVFEELQIQGHFGKGFANMAKITKMIRGSEREIINPLENIVKNTYVIIDTAERNNIMIMMANAAKNSKELGRIFERIKIPKVKVATVSVAEINKKHLNSQFLDKDFLEIITGGSLNKMIDIFRPSLFIPKDNVIAVLMGGKRVLFKVDPMLYKALAATEMEQTSIYLKLLSAPASWLRAGAVLTPDFMARNVIRDTMGAFVYSKYGLYTPVNFAKGLFSLLRKDKDYWMWKMSGGQHSMLVSMDRDYLSKSLNEVIGYGNIKKLIKNPIEMMRVLAEFSETPTRLGEFKKGIAKMKSPIDAGYASREISIDFAKMGVGTRNINRIVAFFNANFESWDKLIRAHKHHPVRTVSRAVGGITIPSIALYLANRSDPRWKEIPQWQKDLSWIIFTKKKEAKEWEEMSIEQKKEHLQLRNFFSSGIYRIPKPFQLGIIYGSIPERILEYIDNNDPKAMDELADSLLFGQMPGVSPTALTPLFEVWTNWNLFLDKSIVPQSKLNMPAEAQYSQYTSETAKELGKIFSYPPAKIDHIFGSYFAGLGKYTISAVDKILIGTGISNNIKPEPTMSDKFVVKAFSIRRPIGSSSKSVNRFFEIYKDIEGKEQMLKMYLDNNEMDKFEEYMNKYPEVFMAYDKKNKIVFSTPARYYRKVAADIGVIRKLENEIYVSKDISPRDKRIKIILLDELTTKLAQEALKFKVK